jgi:hypothetical protein
MLIVAMTLAVLGALGLYALKAASTEVKTSGYARQSAQTQYMAEYGGLVSTQSMAGSLGSMQLAAAVSNATKDTLCLSLQGIDLLNSGFRSQACRRVGDAELQKTVWNGGGVTPVEKYQPGAKTGSPGPVPLTGDYFVEITDPACVPGTRLHSGGNSGSRTRSRPTAVEPDQTVLALTIGVTRLRSSPIRVHRFGGPFSRPFRMSCGTQ